MKVDLTKYDKRCNVGSTGYTIPDIKLSMWGAQDRFIAVRFDNGAQLDVLWNNLEAINEGTDKNG